MVRLNKKQGPCCCHKTKRRIRVWQTQHVKDHMVTSPSTWPLQWYCPKWRWERSSERRPECILPVTSWKMGELRCTWRTRWNALAEIHKNGTFRTMTSSCASSQRDHLVNSSVGAGYGAHWHEWDWEAKIPKHVATSSFVIATAAKQSLSVHNYSC